MWPVPVHAQMRHVLSVGLFRYGQTVGRSPWPFILLPALVLGGLGAGLVLMDRTHFTEDIYQPHNVQSVEDQKKVQELFSDRTGDHYDALELTEDQIMGSIIFIAKGNASVYDDDVITEIRGIIADVKANVTTVVNNVTLNYDDLCGRRHNVCVVTGERLLAPQFNAMRNMSILTYPKWKLPTTGDMVDLSFALADADEELKRVGVVRVTFKLRHDRQPEVFAWEDAFVKFMQGLVTTKTDIVFSASSSISREIENNFRADVFLIWQSLGLVALCMCLVTWGADMVSTRAFLVPMGLVSPALGVLAAMGLLSLCNVKVVQTVWVTPLLVLGVGVSDMSLLMTSWSSRLHDHQQTVPQRLGWVVVDVGPALTATSLSLFVACCSAYTSSFQSVAGLCLYAGVAVIFTYLSTMTFGLGCLAVHARRVISSRHAITCQVTVPYDHGQTEMPSAACVASMCGGNPPSHSYGDQGVLERIPRRLLQKLIQNIVARVVVVVLYVVLLVVSIVGVIFIKQGVDLQTLVTPTSYTHEYLVTDAKYFGFSFPVVFVLDEGVEYNKNTADLVVSLLNRTRQDPGIDDDFVRCWLIRFLKSSVYNRTTEGENFPTAVIEDFVQGAEMFMNDIVLDETGQTVAMSRCYVFTDKSSDQEEMTALMKRMRKLANDADINVFAYHPAFLNYDQRLAVLPSLFQTLAIFVLVLLAVHLIIFPELVITMVAVASITSTILATLGLMSFIGVSVSFMSITHIILNTGFALYFPMHVGAAYLQSEFTTRSDRVHDAVARAAVPMFLSIICTMAGVLSYVAATSYSVAVLFRVTGLTLLVAFFHAVFLNPTILTWVGCQKSQEEMDKDRALKEEMNQSVYKSAIKIGKNTRSSDTVRSQVSSSNIGLTNHWPSYINTPSTTSAGIHILGEAARERQRPSHEQNGELSYQPAAEPIADYENISVKQCPHGLTANSYENAWRSMSSHGYSRLPRLSSTVSYYGGSKDEYDVPIYLPSSRRYREHQQNRNNIHTDFNSLGSKGWLVKNSMSLPTQGLKSRQGESFLAQDMKSKQGELSFPAQGMKSKQDELSFPAQGMKSRQGELRGYKSRGQRQGHSQADVVASLAHMDALSLKSCETDHKMASLEGVHHVACTLSTHGMLGASQAYVTENFQDIPY